MRVHVNLPDELVRDIDDLAGKGKRSEYIAEIVAEEVQARKLQDAIERGAGILSDEDYPHFSSTEKIAQWLRELRDTPSIRRDPIDEVLTGLDGRDGLAQRKNKRPRTPTTTRRKPAQSLS